MFIDVRVCHLRKVAVGLTCEFKAFSRFKVIEMLYLTLWFGFGKSVFISYIK